MRRASRVAGVFIVLFLCVALLPMKVRGEEATSILVKVIDVRGNKRLDKNTILYKLKTRVGDPFDVMKVREDVKTLYKTGFFETVDVDAEPFEGGVKLTYIVKERPLVSKVKIEGNKKVKSDDLRKEMKPFPFSIYNENVLRENIRKIEQLYQAKGYYDVKVTPITKRVGDRLELTYKIVEGDKAHIAKIEFVGNKEFSDRKLKEVMLSKERTLFNWAYTFISKFFGKPATYYYIPDLFRMDLMKVREFYRDHGFLRVLVGEPEVTVKNKDEIFIKVPIEEGPRYKVEMVDMEIGKDDPFNKTQLMKILKLKPGDWYSASKMRKDVTNLTDIYGSRGYVNADVRPLVDVDDKTHLVNVDYRIEKGDLYYVGLIEVRGNTKTRDKVIRRELGITEGNVMNTLALKRAKQRLSKLGYFSQVDIETKPTPQKDVDVTVNVEEASTGSLVLGGGYSSVESFGGMISIGEKNLFGRGQSLDFSGEFTTKRIEYDITFYDPYFLDHPFSLGLKTHKRTYEYDDFDEDTLGFTLTVGKPIRLFGQYMMASVGYEFLDVDITSVDNDAPGFIQDQEGKSISSALLFSFSQDTRNSAVLPTKGFKRSLYLKVAGLGGDEYYYKVVADAGWYFDANKFIDGSVFHVRGRVGFMNPLPFGGSRSRPIYERFYVGGGDTVRGFATDEAGPEEDGSAIGGTKELIFNFEYLFPIVSSLKGVVFYDTGAAFDNGDQFSLSGMRHAIGFGVRLLTPFGPLKVDMGFKLDKKKDEDLSKVSFSVGTMF